jgi:hypothetical protein
MPDPAAPAESAPAERPRRGRPRGKPLSESELHARRVNIRKAHAADPDDIYRPTARRRAASRANIQKAVAWRRSAQGNAIARLNAFKHGLAAKQLPELLARFGEAPEDFEKHHEQARQVFRPEGAEERHLVARLARATWRHMRIFGAQARLERYVWRRLLARGGQARRTTLAEVSDRACELSKLYAEAPLVDNEAYKLQDHIERILESLIRERARREGVRC